MKRLFSLLVAIGVLHLPVGASANCPDLLSSSPHAEPTLLELYRSPEMRSLLPLLPGSMPAMVDYLLDRGSSYGEVLQLWGKREHKKTLNTLLKQKVLLWFPQAIRSSIREILFFENGLIRGIQLEETPELFAYVQQHGFDFVETLGLQRVEFYSMPSRLPRANSTVNWKEIFERLGPLQKLKQLHLEGVELSAPALAAMSKLSQLELLSLKSPSRYLAEELFESIAKMESLRTLQLRGVPSFGQIALLSALPQLHRISMGDVFGNDLIASDFEALGRLRHLTQLRLHGLTPVGSLTMASPLFRDLTHLSVEEIALPREWLEALLSGGRLTNAQILTQTWGVNSEAVQIADLIPLLRKDYLITHLEVPNVTAAELSQIVANLPYLNALTFKQKIKISPRAELDFAVQAASSGGIDQYLRQGRYRIADDDGLPFFRLRSGILTR